MDELSVFPWGKTSCTPRELIENFRDRFPLVVKVTDGYCGDSSSECLSRSEIWWCHSVDTQTRVICRDRAGRWHSIPSNYPALFTVDNAHKLKRRGTRLKRSTRSDEPITLANILDRYKLKHDDPIEVTVVKEGALVSSDGQYYTFQHLTLVRSYKERFIRASRVKMGSIQKHLISIPTYIQAGIVVAEPCALIEGMKTTLKSSSITNDTVNLNHDVLSYAPEEAVNFTKQCDTEDSHYELLAPFKTYTPVYDKLTLRPEADKNNIYDVIKEKTDDKSEKHVSRPALPPKPKTSPGLSSDLNRQQAIIMNQALIHGKPALRSIHPVDKAKKAIKLQTTPSADLGGPPITNKSQHTDKASTDIRPEHNIRARERVQQQLPLEEAPPPVPPRKQSLHTSMIMNKPLPKTPKANPPYERKKIQIETLSSEQLGLCLSEMGLEQYVKLFEVNQINGELLLELDELHLVDNIGMTSEEAKRILYFCRTGYV